MVGFCRVQPVVEGKALEPKDLKNMKRETDIAEAIYGKAVALRQSGQFGEAINAFREAAELAENGLGDAEDGPERDALQEIIKKSLASVELIQEINGFVNTDLMNP